MMNILEFSSPADATAVDHFHQVARDVYRADPVWVPQSETSFQQCLASGALWMRAVVIMEGGRPLARAAALQLPGVVDDAVRSKPEPQGYIAFFECLAEVPRAGQMALQACEDLLRGRGVGSIQAPRVDNMLMGLQVSGFDLPQTVLTPHNPPDYLDIFTRQGFTPRERLVCFQFDRDSVPPRDILSRPTALLARALPGIRTRAFNRARLEDEIRLLNELQTEIFRAHPGYVPRTLAEDRAMVESFLPMLDDDLVIIAEEDANAPGGGDAGCRPAGILICLPDAYQAFKGQPIDRARLISIGAVPRLAHRGVGVLMAMHLARSLLEKGYQSLEGSWIRESNLPPQNMVRRFGGKPGREFVLLEKRLWSNAIII